MTDMLESRISIYFERLFIPIFNDIEECVFDLKYEDLHYRFKYPQEVPHLMPIYNPYEKEKNQIFLTVMIKAGKKYRKIAKGEINLYKKYFHEEKKSVDKWVHLELYQTQIEQMVHNTNILKAVSNTGKIFMKAQLIDSILEEGAKVKGPFDNLSVYTTTTVMTKILQNNLKNVPVLKDKAQANKTEKFRSITEHQNEFLMRIKRGQQNIIEEELYEDIEEEGINILIKLDQPKKPEVEEFDDGLSDVSISIIDGTEENHIEIDKMNLEIDVLVSRIKVIFDNKIDNLLPTDPKELKEFIDLMTTQVNNVSDGYSQNLSTISEINKRIKFQAKDYYERYKTLKRQFKKERRDLKNKNKMLEYDSKHNIDENNRLNIILSEVKNELAYFKYKIGMKDEEKRDEDLEVMVDILNSVKSEMDIFNGLNDTQKASLGEILEQYKEEENQKENNEIILSEENSNEIIDKIEEIVNDLFGKGKIKNIQINQKDDNIYEFNKAQADLIIEDGNLKVSEKTGNVLFEDWILERFSLEENKTPNVKTTSTKKTPTATANGKPDMNSLLEKKLAEKKALLNANTNKLRNAKTPTGKKA